MGKRFAFDINAAIPAAWDLCWAANVKDRLTTAYRPSTTYYLTASDIEQQVRQFAEETVAGEAWGTRGRAWGRGYGSRIRMCGDLNRQVRNWLLDQVRIGKLASHNFGRGHISGMRFRPAGEPISEAETNTLAVKAQRASKPRPVHFLARDLVRKSFLCAPEKRPSVYGRNRSQAHRTTDKACVTCPRCIKIIQAQEKESANA